MPVNESFQSAILCAHRHLVVVVVSYLFTGAQIPFLRIILSRFETIPKCNLKLRVYTSNRASKNSSITAFAKTQALFKKPHILRLFLGGVASQYVITAAANIKTQFSLKQISLNYYLLIARKRHFSQLWSMNTQLLIKCKCVYLFLRAVRCILPSSSLLLLRTTKLATRRIIIKTRFTDG